MTDGVVSALSEKILHFLNIHDNVDTFDAATHFNEDHQKVIGAVKSLQAVDDVSVCDLGSTRGILGYGRA